MKVLGNKMKQEYLLDTNAFFNILKTFSPDSKGDQTISEEIRCITSGDTFISSITKVEIISTLGKYARGISGGFQKCTCTVDEKGTMCTHSKYVAPRKKWNNKKLKNWLKLIDEVTSGRSSLMNVKIKSFDEKTIIEAQRVVQHALTYSFGSLDAMIVSTALIEIENGNELIVVTSDKGMKACLKACCMSVLDPFKKDD